MTVGELKAYIEDLDDNMIVVVSEYNRGYGGLFEAGARVETPDEHDRKRVGSNNVLVIDTGY